MYIYIYIYIYISLLILFRPHITIYSSSHHDTKYIVITLIHMYTIYIFYFIYWPDLENGLLQHKFHMFSP